MVECQVESIKDVTALWTITFTTQIIRVKLVNDIVKASFNLCPQGDYNVPVQTRTHTLGNLCDIPS